MAMQSTLRPPTAGPRGSADDQPMTTVRRRRHFRFNSAYVFVAPTVILMAIFIVEPMLQSAWMSLHDWTIGESVHRFVGAGNYLGLLQDDRFWNALKVTWVYTVFVAVGQVVLGLALASRLRRTTWFTSLLRAAYFFPFIGSLAVVGIVWKFLLDPQVGLVDAWMTKLGILPIEWLQSTSLALPSVIAIGIWKNLGFTMIVLLAGMQGVPEQLYEAATLDGANGWQRFRHVTLPSIRPALLFSTVIATVTGLQLFDMVYVMTSGGPIFHTESIVMYIYQRGFVDFRMGYASAIAWVLFLMILAISLVQLRLLRSDDDD